MKQILTIIFLLTAVVCNAQWLPDVRFTNDPSSSHTSPNNARCIASSGDSIHVAWYDLRDANLEIYYCRSVNGGTTWGPAVRLTNNVDESTGPCISVSGQNVHIAWTDFRDGNNEVYYKRSTDAGTTWQADVRITNDTAHSVNPSIYSLGQNVHLAWTDIRTGNAQIFYKLSTDEGSSWNVDQRMTMHDSVTHTVTVTASGQLVHLAWDDLRHSSPEIYYRSSTNGGISWLAENRLTNDPETSIAPCLSSSGNTVHLVWMDNRTGGEFENYYKRSTDGGSTWGADIPITTGASEPENPSIAASGSAVHVVWTDARDVDPEIYYKRSTDGGTTWQTDTRLTTNPDLSILPSLSASGNAVHVVWQDIRDGNFEVYYKRNPTGNSVGVTTISTEIPSGYKLEQNYPNPFNPKTIINYQLSMSNSVRLNVYDINGKLVKVLVNEKQNAGSYAVTFDGTGLASGVYFYKLETEGFTDVKKMLLIK